MADGNKKVDADDDKTSQYFAALGIGFVCLVIGLPLWWKTTTVYRVDLPYNDVVELASSPVHYVVDTHVIDFTDGNDFNADFVENLKSNLKRSDELEGDVFAQYDFYLRKSSQQEKNIFFASQSLEEFDVQLEKSFGLRQNGNYTICLLPGRFKTNTVFVGRGRTAFIRVAQERDVGGLIQYVLQDVFVNEASVLKGFIDAKRSVAMKADKESMRGLRSYPGYEITFTLLNPQPDMLRISWNITDAIQKYLKPFLNEFAEYADIKIKSQFLHHTGLGVTAQKDATRAGFYLNTDQLPHIINPIEGYLGSHVSNNPNLNFIVYIPTRDQSPLIIHDSSGNPAAKNAFLSPRWGGLMIYNVGSPPPKAKLPVPVEVDMKEVMSVFTFQLKLLLGIHQKVVKNDVTLAHSGIKLISDWELDLWLREHCIQNIVTSSTTLWSLTDLLDKISNIVINDDIGKEVENAVKSIRKSKDFLKMANLKDAFLSSKRAMLASEAAFFDPSLLELLYFPEDQKYAIYIPLFLPIGIPIVLSVLQAIKWFMAKRKEKKD